MSALAGIGAGLVAGAGNILGSVSGSKASAREAQRNRDFMERMSSTSYQRQMADMKAAGLNPMLASQIGGASTPGGSQGQVFSPQDAGSSAVAAKQQAALTSAQVDLMKDQSQAQQGQFIQSLATAMAQSTQADVNSAQASRSQIIDAGIQAAYNELQKKVPGLPDLFNSSNAKEEAKSQSLLEGAGVSLGSSKDLLKLIQAYAR